MRKLMTVGCVLAVWCAAFGGEVQPQVEGDTLTFDVTGDDNTYSTAITGAKSVVKKGSGTLSLKGANTFTGTITIEANGGTLTGIGAIGTLGNPSAIVIESGGALKTPQGCEGGLLNADVTISGNGPDGKGAIVNNSGNNKSFFKSLTLAADASVNMLARGGVMGSRMDMNGYTLTINGTQLFNFNNNTINAGDPADGSRHARIVHNTSIIFQNHPTFNGDPAVNCIKNGTSGLVQTAFWGNDRGIPWPYDAGNGAPNFTAQSGVRNAWSGPVLFTANNSVMRLQTSAGCEFRMTGGFYAPSTKNVENRGAGAASTNWISAPIVAAGGFNVYGGDLVLYGDGTQSNFVNNITVCNKWTAGANTTVTDGSVELSGLGAVTNGPRFRLGADVAGRSTHLVVSGTTGFEQSGFFIHPYADDTCNYMDFRDGVVAEKANIYMGTPAGWDGGDHSLGTNAHNAVYIRGAKFRTRNAGGLQDLYVSEDHNSYGYIGMTAGDIASYTLHLGAGSSTIGGPSVFHLKGGVATFPSVAMSRGGRDSVYYQCGGVSTNTGNMRVVLNAGDFSSLDGESLTVFTGSNTVANVNSGNINVQSAGGRAFRTTIALNDGAILRHHAIQRENPTSGVDSDVYFAANGGVMDRLRGDIVPFSGLLPESEFGHAYLTLYGEGLVMNVESNKCLNGSGVYQKASLERGFGFSAPTGNGIVSIALPADPAFQEEKYLGPPIVKISDATGKGAAAVAEFDEETRTVTGIKVVAPGFDFSDNPTVTVASRDRKTAYACVATVAPNVSGGFTKTGDGEFGFNNYCTNTYTGATRILGGTVSFGLYSIPTDSAFVIAKGAVLDMTASGSGNHFYSLKSLSGSGRILAGSTTAGVTGPREFTFREGFTLKAGEPLVTDGVINWTAGATLTVENPEELDESGAFVPLLQADAGIKGLKSNLTLANLDADKWRVTVRGTQLGVRKRVGMAMIFR